MGRLAEESAKTKKARAKLQMRLAELDKRVNTQALEQKNAEIHRWIARHAQQRMVLKTKTISLFDENKNTAGISRRVAEIASRLQHDSV